MYAIGKKPAIVLGTTAMIALGASGISAQARSTSKTTNGTTPAGAVGKGRGLDTAALAKQLGISESALQTAMDAVRTELGVSDRSTDLKAEAQAIADSLGVDVSTITTIFEAQISKSAKAAGSTPPTTPSADYATPGTTPSADTARPTTPPAGGPGKGGHGKGGPGRGPDQAALIAAIVKATGKSETDVKTALAAGRTAHDKAEAARQAKFAELLAAKLGLETSKVSAALDAVKPVRPAQAAKATTTSTS